VVLLELTKGAGERESKIKKNPSTRTAVVRARCNKNRKYKNRLSVLTETQHTNHPPAIPCPNRKGKIEELT
jgi:hypothetical protein